MDDYLKETLARIETKLESIELVQNEQAVDLKFHIKRTNDLQLMVEPTYKLHTQFVGVLKFLGVVSLIVGLYKMIKFFTH